MGILKFAWNIIPNVALILFNERSKEKWQLFLTYARLKFKYMIFIKILKSRLVKERIFGFNLELFDYTTFIFMFEHIFIRMEYFFHTQEPRPMIIDCGSNIGMAVIYFKRLYPKAKIIAFEPDKETFELLRRNVESNNLHDVELHNRALTNSEGFIDFYYDPIHPGSLRMSTLLERLPIAKERVVSVTLSNHVNEKIDFMKMDIEGAEFPVLQELAERQKIHYIEEMVVEYHHHIGPEDDCLSKILILLEQNKFGYQLTATVDTPFMKKALQDILIYAYKNIEKT